MGNTYDTLASDLLLKIDSPMTTLQQKNLARKLLLEARSGRFHDFATELATPKFELRKELLKANFGDLAKKVIDGEYDDESPNDKMPMNFQIRDKEAEVMLREIGTLIAKGLPKDWGFTLLLFDYKEPPNSSLFYISSAQREEMLKTMQEFIKKHS